MVKNKIIYNIGLPRTGTRSIAYLFNTLGFKFKHSYLSNNDDYNINYEYLVNNINKFKENNTFYSDTPIWHKEFWDIMNLYKNSVICTYRDKESWIKSIVNFKYIKNQNFLQKDIYWYKNNFDNLNYEHLSKVYDCHMIESKKFKNILYVDIINNDNKKKLNEILEFINIKNNNYEIINYNTMFKTI